MSKSREEILLNLNDRQAQAVIAPLGPVLVLAGAGSGKTKVLTHRIAYLISEQLFRAENILALTFTNKAAKEMQGRVQKIITGAGMPMMGTFHSICLRILRQEIQALGYNKSFVIYDDDDQDKVFREILQARNVGARFSPRVFRNYISSAKNALQTPNELNLPIDTYVLNLVREVYTDYQNYLFQQNALDFDDLLMLTVKIFQNFPEVLKKYQQIFKYILVDEYQDTNHVQYMLLFLLAIGTDENVGSRNLFVVGDDAQSIYGFRGSNLRNILDFEEHFPDCLVIKLEQNYRSTKNILAVAQEVIDLNVSQKAKKLWTENIDGDKIKLFEVEDETEEAKIIAKTIIRKAGGVGASETTGGSGKTTLSSEVTYESEDSDFGGYEDDQTITEEQPKKYSILDHFLKKQNTKGSAVRSLYGIPQLPKDHDSLNKYAVLYRTHAQSRALEEVFLQAQIPYQIVGGLKFYQRKEIKDTMAYLRLITNHRDLVALKRVINEPARGFGDKSYSVLKNLILQDNEKSAGRVNDSQTQSQQSLAEFRIALADIQLPPKQFNVAQNFFTLIEECVILDPNENLLSLMRLVLKKSGYEAWVKVGDEESSQRWENIEELFNVASKYQNLPWKEALEAFLEEVALMTDIDNLNDQKDSVTFMSLHQAKGLEFDTVFLIGLEEGILPHSRALLSPSELEEEIRLAYVGITRARKNLYLIYAQARRLFGQLQSFAPSRIIKSLPDEQIDFKIISRY